MGNPLVMQLWEHSHNLRQVFEKNQNGPNMLMMNVMKWVGVRLGFCRLKLTTDFWNTRNLLVWHVWLIISANLILRVFSDEPWISCQLNISSPENKWGITFSTSLCSLPHFYFSCVTQEKLKKHYASFSSESLVVHFSQLLVSLSRTSYRNRNRQLHYKKQLFGLKLMCKPLSLTHLPKKGGKWLNPRPSSNFTYFTQLYTIWVSNFFQFSFLVLFFATLSLCRSSVLDVIFCYIIFM
jgi:hypothetical protein